MNERQKALIGAVIALTCAPAAPAAPPPAFAMCGICHRTAKGEPAAIGPNLWGVGGRKVGAAPGYVYSPAMAKAPLRWDRATLIAFITAPQAKVPGTKMAFAGQKNPKLAGDIADYLLSLK